MSIPAQPGQSSQSGQLGRIAFYALLGFLSGCESRTLATDASTTDGLVKIKVGCRCDGSVGKRCAGRAVERCVEGNWQFETSCAVGEGCACVDILCRETACRELGSTCPTRATFNYTIASGEKRTEPIGKCLSGGASGRVLEAEWPNMPQRVDRPLTVTTPGCSGKDVRIDFASVYGIPLSGGIVSIGKIHRGEIPAGKWGQWVVVWIYVDRVAALFDEDRLVGSAHMRDFVLQFRLVVGDGCPRVQTVGPEIAGCGSYFDKCEQCTE